MEDKLKTAREKISRIDAEISKLFTERMKAAEAVAEYKREHGLPVYDKAREDELIAKNSALVSDDTLRPYYVEFLRDTMKISRDYQHYLLRGARIAYCGEVGAFAYFAAKKIFPDGNPVSHGSFSEAYDSVLNGECDFAILPIENSFAGEVGAVTDMIFKGSLVISGIYDMAVTQALLGASGAELSDIKTVKSHPQALSQCAEFIKSHGLLKIEAESTSSAAKSVADTGDRTIAAIACEEAAELYGLSVIKSEINDSRSNTTRFAVFSRCENKSAGKNQNDGFCLVFTVKNEAGALARALSIIGEAGFNMRTLRSRPSKELAWRYYFYIEAEGAVRTEAGEKMMLDLLVCCDRLKIAGIYKQ